MTTFLDTNVLISLLDEAHKFHQWSMAQFQDCKAKGPAIISDIVYCEFSVGMASKDDVDAAIEQFALERFEGDDVALFRAGVAFKQYKANAGPKVNVLPDFLIGAIAEVTGAPLLTANPKDFKKYFPNIKMISP